ncbi:hypothetical protein AM1_D0088 (plasmid) [Acaryochloris marina MBIC11017]|uniref:Uncharacterized protein n=1 Tax=Acaryochloris marina (strain MBIC 11017) TaxID=329726 RepID=A8ZNJ7_ACAM1|nr:hypothetical protein AM1_D0088 [Acaryochloris marina MBIC11017]
MQYLPEVIIKTVSAKTEAMIFWVCFQKASKRNDHVSPFNR